MTLHNTTPEGRTARLNPMLSCLGLAVFSLVLLVSIAALAVLGWITMRFDQQSVDHHAVVTSCQMSTGPGSSVELIYDYEVGDEHFSGSGRPVSAGGCSAYPAGESVAIVYLSENPHLSRLANEATPQSLFILLLSLTGSVVAILVLLRLRMSRPEH